MINVIKTLFYKRDNSDYQNALCKLAEIKQMLELGKPKSIKFKEIFITEINF